MCLDHKYQTPASVYGAFGKVFVVSNVEYAWKDQN